MKAFDLLGPLPQGTTLLEASAGTGKTYTIAALATRYIAEGAATIDQMLLVTFGRAATRELRERVREALTRARDALRSDAVPADLVVAHLAGLPVAERTAAAARLARAVADFDSGTIATTHQFCSQALQGLGIAADTDPGEVFADSIADVIDEVVDDFYVRKYVVPSVERLRLDEARDLARAAVNDAQAALDAGPVAEGTLAATRMAFAHAVRAEVLRRRRARRLVTFDDLVVRLLDAVSNPDSGEQTCRRLRERYRVVLVDEFQDTDPAQWDILRAAFHGHRTLVLIGDPKQAIYAFRGADVFSYLDAAEHADHRATLPTNHRSDPPVVDGIDALLGGMYLGDPRIVVRPVTARRRASRLSGVADEARVRLRLLPAGADDLPPVKQVRAVIARDVAADIVDTLNGPAQLDGRPVAPGDIAVLCGTHKQADAVVTALSAADVPAVVTSQTSVFTTAAATDWAVLLRAMQRPRGAALRAAALTDFCGRSPQDLALRGEGVDAQTAGRLREWAQVLDGSSVAQMWVTIDQQTQVAARVLGRPDGERRLTDLRHVAGALHARQRSTGSGPVALLDWLEGQMRRAREDGREPTDDLTRRLESDADAVQVLTIHASKGLEFPLVYVPYGWDRWVPDQVDLLRCHDAAGRRVLDVRGRSAPDRDDLLRAHREEEAGESLRLLYVALTRASSRLVVHWAASHNTRPSPLHRVLAARREGSSEPAPAYPVAPPPVPGSPWVTIETVGRAAPRPWAPPARPSSSLAVAPFTRTIDTAWRRTSYSGLTAAAHAEQGPHGFRDDEPAEEAEALPASGAALPSPFADLPAGAAFGTLVHSVLEAVDPMAADLGAELQRRCGERLARFPVAGVTHQGLAEALEPVLRTPLGPLALDLSLADLPIGERLAELDFELPMPGGRTVADLAQVLRDHLSPDDPLAEYPDRLETPGLAENVLLGYLSGSIDAVLRVPGPRFLVVDYKTNLLRDPGAPGVESLVCGYDGPALARAMMDAHYPLQAVLYSVALHRYLRWRVPGYSPQHHLGGVLYLFLRGMAGPGTPAGHGVFAWSPPAALVTGLSDLLDGAGP